MLILLKNHKINNGMKLKLISVCIIILFSCGCIFSGDDIEEKQIVSSYYISSLGNTYTLTYKEPEASTEKIIITTNVDSVGWKGKVIFGLTSNEYFIIDIKSHITIGRFKKHSDFIKANQDLGNEAVILTKTSEL